MKFDICFYKYSAGALSQYPALDYAKEVIIESVKLTSSLHGKRQFSLIKRGDSGHIQLYHIYNYVYNGKNDSFGICIVYYDKYPYDIDYMFKLCGSIVTRIIRDGESLYLNSKGEILSSDEDLGHYYSALNRYKEQIKSSFLHHKEVKSIPLNVYNNPIGKHVICQLSDNSWSLDNLLAENNIIIFTEKIEEENLNRARNIITKLNETINNQNLQIKKLNEKLSKANASNKQLQKRVNSMHKPANKVIIDVNVIYWIFFGISIIYALINLGIYRFTHSSFWIYSIPCALSYIGFIAIYLALYDRFKRILFWSGTITLFLSLLTTLYNIYIY